MNNESLKEKNHILNLHVLELNLIILALKDCYDRYKDDSANKLIANHMKKLHDEIMIKHE